MEVVLKEIKPEFLQAGIQRIEANIESMVKKGKMKPEKAKAILGRVRGTLDDRDFANVDMVIEAVIENLNLKTTTKNSRICTALRTRKLKENK